MASKATPSETLAWWARAVQARRVAGMLSPRDAQMAEAYAEECEDQARESSFRSFRSKKCLEGLVPNPVGSASPKQILFCRD